MLCFFFFILFLKYDINLDRIETSENQPKTSEDFSSFFKFNNINIVKQEKDGNAVTVSGNAELLKDLDKSKEVQFLEISSNWYLVLINVLISEILTWLIGIVNDL